MLLFVMSWLLTWVHANELTPIKADELDVYQIARAMSIDLRGMVLSSEEIDELQSSGTVEDTLLDEWLYSEEFEEQVVEFHKSLFWNKVSFSVNHNRRLLRSYSRFAHGTGYAYYRSGEYRGVFHTQCSDYPADVNSLNQPQSWIIRDPNTGAVASEGWKDEGYVWVNPWWDMNNPIKVCAFDAQLTQISSTGTDCSTYDGNVDPECGCGENLKWCNREGGEGPVQEAFSDALSAHVRAVLQNEAPYSDILTESKVMMNGPLVEYYQNRSNFSDAIESPVPSDQLPSLSAQDVDTWVEIPMDDHYAGVLTEPGWLLRHQTDRGRASRFYSAFLCREFQTPSGGIQELIEENPTPDLSRKPVCQDCHVLLEPWAAYWGRWEQAGALYLSQDDYPTFSNECDSCAPNCGQAYCKLNYLLDSTHPHQDDFIGVYNPYVFLLGDAADNPDNGPKEWANEIVSDGRFAQCASRNAAMWLMGWSTEEVDSEWVQTWADDFEASGLDYRVLIRSIVTSPVYGRSK